MTDLNRRNLPQWGTEKLGSLIEEAQPGFACGERDFNGTIQLRMNNVDTRGNIIWDDFLRVPADTSTIEKYSLVDGDVVFNNTNSVELVGKSAVFHKYDEPVVYSNHFTRLRVIQYKLSPAYLSFWLQLQWRNRVFENICNRWIGQSAVKNDKLLALEIPLPPFPEQQRIAAILNERLSAVERARQAAEEQNNIISIILSAYTRDIFNCPEAKKWPKENLDNICREITDGTHVTPVYVQTGIPFLSVKDIRETKISFNDCRFITREQYMVLNKHCNPERGDVLYTKVGTTGIAKTVDTDREFSIFVSVALLKLKPKVIPDYLEIVLNSPLGRKQAENLTQGMANRNLVLKDLKRIEVPIPPIPVQQRLTREIKEKMEFIDNLRSHLNEQLSAINSLPIALLRQAFNGELLYDE